MAQVTTHKILVAIREQFVCLLAYYSNTYEWILMKFSGKIDMAQVTSHKILVAIRGLFVCC